MIERQKWRRKCLSAGSVLRNLAEIKRPLILKILNDLSAIYNPNKHACLARLTEHIKLLSCSIIYCPCLYVYLQNAEGKMRPLALVLASCFNLLQVVHCQELSVIRHSDGDIFTIEGNYFLLLLCNHFYYYVTVLRFTKKQAAYDIVVMRNCLLATLRMFNILLLCVVFRHLHINLRFLLQCSENSNDVMTCYILVVDFRDTRFENTYTRCRWYGANASQ